MSDKGMDKREEAIGVAYCCSPRASKVIIKLLDREQSLIDRCEGLEEENKKVKHLVAELQGCLYLKESQITELEKENGELKEQDSYKQYKLMFDMWEEREEEFKDLQNILHGEREIDAENCRKIVELQEQLSQEIMKNVELQKIINDKTIVARWTNIKECPEYQELKEQLSHEIMKNTDHAKEQLAKIITSSTLWQVGRNGHNALSELVISIIEVIASKRGINEKNNR